MSVKYLTPIQVGQRLNVHPIKVRAWITSGKLKALNVSAGKRPEYRIPEPSLLAFEQSLIVKVPACDAKARRNKRMRGIPNYV